MALDISTNPNQSFASLTSYESYAANLIQKAPYSLTEGLLASGVLYRIDTFNAGDDFTNVGAESNTEGIEFIATGTTPATWSNGSVIVHEGKPALVGTGAHNKNDSNFLGNIVWSRDSAGQSRGTLAGKFRQYKTLILCCGGSDDLSSLYAFAGAYESDDEIVLKAFDVSGFADNWQASLMIVVYPAD
jgi:hypothetical protein